MFGDGESELEALEGRSDEEEPAGRCDERCLLSLAFFFFFFFFFVFFLCAETVGREEETCEVENKSWSERKTWSWVSARERQRQRQQAKL